MSTTTKTLLRPRACPTCPFTNPDRDAVCRPSRRREIQRGVTLDDATFHCHSEVTYSDDGEETEADTYGARQCAGMTTLLLRDGAANQVMRFADRIGEPLTEDDRVQYRSLSDWVGDDEDPAGEACNTVNAGCTAPAGWLGSGGGVVTNMDTFAELHCAECCEPVCEACATEIGGSPVCGYCADYQEEE